jgi:hypothetical protein
MKSQEIFLDEQKIPLTIRLLLSREYSEIRGTEGQVFLLVRVPTHIRLFRASFSLAPRY